jgi:hypothetical protein
MQWDISMKHWYRDKRKIMETKKQVAYLIGSLRNPQVPQIAASLRTQADLEVFDDWYAAGPEADDYWQKYEQSKSISYPCALRSYAAQHVYQFDLYHLQRADMGILILPAGKSGHLEFGYLIGRGKRGYILFDREPERWDVMYNFATSVHFNLDSLVEAIKRDG